VRKYQLHDPLQTAPGSARSFLPPQSQKLSIGGKELRHRLLELPSSLDSLPDEFNPFIGDAFDPLLVLNHEGEGPHRMALTAGTVTIGLTATTVRQRE
jgi:hypothetical protein